MWAMGAIAAELFTLRPLFPGSSEMDELYRICSVIGTPTDSYSGNQNSGANQSYDMSSENNSIVISGGGSWQEGIRLASTMGFKFPTMPPVPLNNLIPNASTEALQLISDMLKWDPNSRPTAQESLQYPWFRDIWSNVALKNSLLAGTLNKDEAAKANATDKKKETDTPKASDKKPHKQNSNLSSVNNSNNTLSSPTGSFDFDIDDDGNIIKSKHGNKSGHIDSSESLSNINSMTFSSLYSLNNQNNNTSASTLNFNRSMSNTNNSPKANELSSRSSRKSLFRSDSTKKSEEEKLFSGSSTSIANPTDSLFNTNNDSYGLESNNFKKKSGSSHTTKSSFSNSNHNSHNDSNNNIAADKADSVDKLENDNLSYHNSMSHNSNNSLSGIGIKNIKRYHSPTEDNKGLSSSFGKLSLSGSINNGSHTSENLTKNKLKPMNSNNSLDAQNDHSLEPNIDHSKISLNGINSNKSISSTSGNIGKMNQYTSSIYAPPHSLAPKSQNNSSDSINNPNFLNFQSSFSSNNINQRIGTSNSLNNSRHFSNNHHEQSLTSLPISSNNSINGHHQSLPSRPSKYKQLPAIDNQIANKSFLKTPDISMNNIFHENMDINKGTHKSQQTPPNLENSNSQIASNNSLNILQHPNKLNSLSYNSHNVFETTSNNSLSNSISSHPSLLKPLLTNQSKSTIINESLNTQQFQKPVKLESLNSFELNNVRRPSRGEDFTKL